MYAYAQLAVRLSHTDNYLWYKLRFLIPFIFVTGRRASYKKLTMVNQQHSESDRSGYANASAPTPTTNNEIRNHDLLALRAFVTAQDHDISPYQLEHLIVVDLTHSNLQQRHIEVRFHLSDTLADLRHRIYQTTGTPDCDQILQVFDENAGGRMTTQITPDVPDHTPLASILLQRGMRVHCIDTNPYSKSANGALEDTRLVEKFRLTDEQYQARPHTLRRWAQQQKQDNPNFSLRTHAQQHAALQHARKCHQQGMPLPEGFVVKEDGTVQAVESLSSLLSSQNVYDETSVQHATIGSRCQVHPGGRRGQVAWIGQFVQKSNKPGWWIGVALDEPLGNNDGSCDGVRYFTPAGGDRHGCFARGPNVEVGDFPERNLWEEEEDDDDEL